MSDTPEPSVWGIPLHASELVPEGMAIIVNPRELAKLERASWMPPPSSSPGGLFQAPPAPSADAFDFAANAHAAKNRLLTEMRMSMAFPTQRRRPRWQLEAEQAEVHVRAMHARPSWRTLWAAMRAAFLGEALKASPATVPVRGAGANPNAFAVITGLGS